MKCSMHVLLGVGPGVIPGHPVPPIELEEVAGEKEVWLLCCPNVPAPNNQQKMDGWICNEGSRGHFKARFIWAYFTCPSQVSLLGQLSETFVLSNC